ncbi:DNA-directed RNA polymerase subunit delta [Carnobacteriaceae bacterium zg-ZUI252]|nr:DNA-directed RNA polymerase subunit delta [Carnobacteriaceae bacterium zg-ZUI252]MBS4770657.1 DNA-directed RNA polymerase subunit delta [Carnobacteriaceae bacterium zg-ZUI240]QTU82949.1 DNA-directed RNA polymerase subunit delta [Carnobacteriaceae bacterium zg-C25]
MTLIGLEGINKNELSMVEVAHAILEQKGDVMEFNELLVAVQEYMELNDEKLERQMPVFYTELNIDGSFISLGDNRWGLRSWYAIDSIDEELVSLEEETTVRRKKRKKLNAFVTSDDDVDYSNDDPEDEDLDTLDDDEDIDELDDSEETTDLDDYSSDLDTLVDDKDAIEDELTIVSDEEAFEDL